MSEVMQYNSSATPIISLTPAAQARVLRCLTEQSGSIGLRLSVKKNRLFWVILCNGLRT